MRYSIAALNALDVTDFVTVLADIYEHSPWVPLRASQHRPFADMKQLANALHDAVMAADPAERMLLIRAHPELAGKLAMAGELTVASRAEQRGAGLDQCSAAEFAEMNALNLAYQQCYGFPFIIAVHGLNRTAVIAAMRQRLGHGEAKEIATALAEIRRIAWFRLQDLIE
jgi:2-oxo-4-hydroxy-4-carboxy-5-ureidoimidazoline decarboxylase